MDAPPSNNRQHSNALAAELLGRSLRKLSVIDRLRCERVSPRWSWVAGRLGWTEQRKLDFGTVFEDGTTEKENVVRRFWKQDTTEESENERSPHNLIILFERVAQSLLELDIDSFGRGEDDLVGFLPQIAGSLKLFPKLEILNIFYYDLEPFVDFLPGTLRVLETRRRMELHTLETLSVKCPNLEEVEFWLIENLFVDADLFDTFIQKFPRQKRLFLCASSDGSSHGKGHLPSICTLKELEELTLYCSKVEAEKCFKEIAINCTSLRKLCLYKNDFLTESALFHVARMRNLTELVIVGHLDALTDAALKAIARSLHQLKRLKLFHSNVLTDDSIVYLIERCKSLVSLSIDNCPQISQRSVEAVAAEVHRRHGKKPPRTLPNGPRDSGIFYFESYSPKIDREKARQLSAKNPWLLFAYDPRTFV